MTANRPVPRRVLIVGAGGLGCPALFALEGAGVAITVVDDDVVDLSNLHRQVAYRAADVGVPKVEALRRRFPDVRGLRGRVDAANARALVRAFDVVLDGTDRLETKFLLNDACVGEGVALVHGGVIGWAGQLMAILPGEACYRCLFEAPPPPGCVGTCAEDGVIGPVAGVVGTLMAREALNILDGRPELASALLVFDGRSGERRPVRFRRRAGCRACGTEREAFA